jgi:hypothetical protein
MTDSNMSQVETLKLGLKELNRSVPEDPVMVNDSKLYFSEVNLKLSGRIDDKMVDPAEISRYSMDKSLLLKNLLKHIGGTQFSE